jgi:hypothetical protein
MEAFIFESIYLSLFFAGAWFALIIAANSGEDDE